MNDLPVISIIVAMARNRAIGLNNQLLWHIPDDFRWFKRHTLGHPVVMGRRTYLSLPVRPLPGRRNIIITDRPGDCFAGCTCVGSIDESIEQMDRGVENFIIGGASVYAQFLPIAHRLYLTVVDRDYEADVFFPEFDPSEWTEEFRQYNEASPEGLPAFTFLIYKRP